ncbi:hypothetical protein JHK85_010650 [Glycine max]|nr:hypothetical protein JHK85_010650 [Glycine max]
MAIYLLEDSSPWQHRVYADPIDNSSKGCQRFTLEHECTLLFLLPHTTNIPEPFDTFSMGVSRITTLPMFQILSKITNMPYKCKNEIHTSKDGCNKNNKCGDDTTTISTRRWQRRTVLGSKTISAEDRDVTVAARGVGSPSDLLFLFGDEQHYSLIISRPTQSRESKKKRGSEKRFSFSLVVSKKKLSVLQLFVRKMPVLLTLMSNDINCITLVDYYAPLFFLEISTIQPEEFYLKVNLCQLITYIPLQVQEDTSGFCEDIVSTLLAKF